MGTALGRDASHACVFDSEFFLEKADFLTQSLVFNLESQVALRTALDLATGAGDGETS